MTKSEYALADFGLIYPTFGIRSAFVSRERNMSACSLRVVACPKSHLDFVPPVTRDTVPPCPGRWRLGAGNPTLGGLDGPQADGRMACGSSDVSSGRIRLVRAAEGPTPEQQ